MTIMVWLNLIQYLLGIGVGVGFGYIYWGTSPDKMIEGWLEKFRNSSEKEQIAILKKEGIVD